MDLGRVQSFLLASSAGNVIYERFFAKFTDTEKADIRAAFHHTVASGLDNPRDEAEYAGRYKAGITLARVDGDVVLYALGTGEYDELNLAELLKCISAALKDNVSRRLTENSLFENYGKLCLTIDEVINEDLKATGPVFDVFPVTGLPCIYPPEMCSSIKSCFKLEAQGIWGT